MDTNGSWDLGGMWVWWAVGLALAVLIVWLIRQLPHRP
jgi:heme exporter protein D